MRKNFTLSVAGHGNHRLSVDDKGYRADGHPISRATANILDGVFLGPIPASTCNTIVSGALTREFGIDDPGCHVSGLAEVSSHVRQNFELVD